MFRPQWLTTPMVYWPDADRFVRYPFRPAHVTAMPQHPNQQRDVRGVARCLSTHRFHTDRTKAFRRVPRSRPRTANAPLITLRET